MPEYEKRHSRLNSFLHTVPLFEGVQDEILERLVENCRIRRLHKDELLFNQMDPAEGVYIVQSGCIALFLATPDGRELVINEMHPGDCFGELSLITGRPRSTGALARVPSEILLIPSICFMDILNADAELMHRVLELTAQRLRVSSERESALAFLDSKARISRVLLLLDHQTSDEGAIKITQEQLAQHAGLARQTVTKILGQWQARGWIETSRGKIKLRDRDALRKQAEKWDLKI
jgi:CRP/FNR family cyclic AMP-dependent transcriptional regulator